MHSYTVLIPVFWRNLQVNVPVEVEGTFFFAELILKRTISADIWTIPAISPAVSMSNERKTAF
jgi:hypothetical protein